jgi:sortase A
VPLMSAGLRHSAKKGMPRLPGIVILRFGRCLGFALGDDIVIRSGHDLHYRVNRMRIVNPDNISVLTGDNRTRLTLITCYTFRYIGSAPERFIVEAELVR